MIFAAIDIGSNAGRLLISSVTKKNGVPKTNKVSFVRVPLRLGVDVYSKGYIGKKRYEYMHQTLEAFKGLIDLFEIKDIRACGTAALREADNGDEIVKRIKKDTGINIKIIDGIEEARIIRGSGNFPISKTGNSLLVDLGGGSTEITLLKNNKYVTSHSFKIGTIRILQNKVDDKEFDELYEWLSEHKNDIEGAIMLGTGGNINKLVKLYGDHSTQSIDYKQLKKGYDHLKSFTLEERISKMGLKVDRADVIVPAAKFFIKIMKHTKIKSITAPKTGLADGLVYEMFERQAVYEAGGL